MDDSGLRADMARMDADANDAWAARAVLAVSEAHEAALQEELLAHLCGPWGRVPGEGRLRFVLRRDLRFPFGVLLRIERAPEPGA